MEGSSHLMPNEVSVHAQEYGFGGTFYEDELFDTDDEEDEELKPLMRPEWEDTHTETHTPLVVVVVIAFQKGAKETVLQNLWRKVLLLQ